jgi:small conductance mechanosensitive channel
VDLLHSTKVLNIIYAGGLLLVGFFLASRVNTLIERALGNRVSRHHVMLISRATFYLILIIFFVSSLQHLGFNLSVLLGAAGVFTVAVSFASQTAASNLISGIFLLFERPFKIGDGIIVNNITGIVDSIDLLSTKLRTSDNKLVRIPNETLIKSSITNLNYFKTQRIDLIIGIAYNSNLNAVKSVLFSIAQDCEHVLKDPPASVIINNFADSAIELKFMVWVKTHDVSMVKNQLQENIKQQFDIAHIELPFPQVTIHRVKNLTE